MRTGNKELFIIIPKPRDRVRMVGLCPWFVNTELVKSQVKNTNEIEEKYKIRALEIDEVSILYDTFHDQRPI